MMTGFGGATADREETTAMTDQTATQAWPPHDPATRRRLPPASPPVDPRRVEALPPAERGRVAPPNPALAAHPSGMRPPGPPATIPTGAPFAINGSLRRPPRLTGQVVDRSGNPIAASVNSALLPYGAGGNTLADAGGAFIIDLPQDGTHRLSAFAAGFLTTYAPSTIDSNAASSWLALIHI